MTSLEPDKHAPGTLGDLKPPPEQQRKREVDVAKELTAIEKGELRSRKQIESLYEALTGVDAALQRRASRLNLQLLVEGSPLLKTPSLAIHVSPDLKTLRYGEVIETLSPSDLNPADRNGRLFQRDLKINWLITVPDPKLVTPNIDCMIRNGPIEAAERVFTMFGFNERITYFGDLPVTWNGALDSGVWSTNTDTVHFVHWLRKLGVFNKAIERSLEVGAGAGLISQALIADNPHIKEHWFTDISPFAINTTRRTLRPFLNDDKLNWYLGKGLKTLDEQGRQIRYDLIILNPPYIPHPLGHDNVDPYRGTGLIKECFEMARDLLNPNNPDAAIYIEISNLSLKDIERYKKENPDIEVTTVGGPVEVPLKIWGVSREPEWIPFLKDNGLIERPDRAQTNGIRYFHEISAIRLRPKPGGMLRAA